ncbi:hypothetical protein FOL46_009167, partial [Perkinsus olseni]
MVRSLFLKTFRFLNVDPSAMTTPSDLLAEALLAETFNTTPFATHVNLQLLLDAFGKVLERRGIGKADEGAMKAYRAILAKHREASKRCRAERKPFQFRRRKDVVRSFSSVSSMEPRSPPTPDDSERSDAPHFGFEAVSVMDSVVQESHPSTTPGRVKKPGMVMDEVEEMVSVLPKLDAAVDGLEGVGRGRSPSPDRSPVSGRRRFDAGKLFSLSIRCVSRRAVLRWREGAMAQRNNREGLLLLWKRRGLRAFHAAVMECKMLRFREKLVSAYIKSVLGCWKEFTSHRKGIRVRDEELLSSVETIGDFVEANRLTRAFNTWLDTLRFRRESDRRIKKFLTGRAERCIIRWSQVVQDCKKLRATTRIFRLRRGLRALRRFLEASKAEIYRAVEVERSIMKRAWQLWTRYHSWRAGLKAFYATLEPSLETIRQTAVVRMRRGALRTWQRAHEIKRAYDGVRRAAVRRRSEAVLREWVTQLFERLHFQRDCVVHLQKWRLALALHKLAFNRRLGLYKSSGVGYLVERGRLRVLAGVCDAWLGEVRYRLNCSRVEVCVRQRAATSLLTRSLGHWRAQYSHRLLDRARNEMAALQWKRRCLSRFLSAWLGQAVDGRTVREGLSVISGKVKGAHFNAWLILAELVRASRLKVLTVVFGNWYRESARVRRSTVEAGQRAAISHQRLARMVLFGLRDLVGYRRLCRQAGVRSSILAKRRRTRLVFGEWLAAAQLCGMGRRLESRLPRVALRLAFHRLRWFTELMGQRDAEEMARAVLWYFRARLVAWKKRVRWQSIKRRVVEGRRRKRVSLAFGILACWRVYCQRNRQAATLIRLNLYSGRSGAILRAWSVAGRSKQIVDRLFDCHVKQVVVSCLDAWKIQVKSTKELHDRLQCRARERSTALKKFAATAWRVGVRASRAADRRQRLSLDGWRMENPGREDAEWVDKKVVKGKIRNTRRGPSGVPKIVIVDCRQESLSGSNFRESLALNLRCDDYLHLRATPLRSKFLRGWSGAARKRRALGRVEATINAAMEFTRMELALDHWAVQTARAQVMNEIWLVTVPAALLRYRARECLAYWKARVKSEKSSMSRVVMAWRYELPRIIAMERSSESLAVRHRSGKVLKQAMVAFMMAVDEGRELRRARTRLALGRFRRRVASIRARRVRLGAMAAASRLRRLEAAFEGWWNYRVEISERLERYPICRRGRCRKEMLLAYHEQVVLRRSTLLAWRRTCRERAEESAVNRADQEMAKLLEIDRLLRPAFQAIRDSAVSRKCFTVWCRRAERSWKGRILGRRGDNIRLGKVWAVWAK